MSINQIETDVANVALSWACEPDRKFLTALRQMQEVIATEYAGSDQTRMEDGIALAQSFARACVMQREAMQFDAGQNLSKAIH